MKRPVAIWTVIALTMALAAAASWIAPAANAQFSNAAVVGVVYNQEGKPFADVTLVFEDERGRKTEAKTDKDGHYAARSLQGSAVYTVAVKFQDKQLFQFKVQTEASKELTHDVNFKELIAKEGGAAAEAVKKQEEQKQKAEGMKARYDAGMVVLEQARQDRKELRSVQPDHRDAAKQKLSVDANQAQTDFQEALKAAPEKDSNLHLIWFRIGEAYDLAGKNEEAADTYQKAILLKPDAANYYVNLGNVLANLGKIDEAKAAYQKSAELDPPNAAMAWHNLGIVLTNLNRQKEAIEPLKKATELDPKNAQTWLLLGRALVNAMDYKKEGDKITPILLPGTVEAYQKAFDLDPNGPIGKDAKAGLEALEQLAPGINTKVNTRKKKS